MILLHVREQHSPSGSIWGKCMGRLNKNATAIAAAQATHLLLMSALCHYSGRNGSGLPCWGRMVWSDRSECVVRSACLFYTALCWLFHALLMCYWNIKDSPRFTSPSPPAKRSATRSCFSEALRWIFHCIWKYQRYRGGFFSVTSEGSRGKNQETKAVSLHKSGEWLSV